MCGKGKSREETKKYCMSLLFRCSHSRLILSGGGAAWPWAGPGGQCRHPGGRDGALRAAGTPLRPARLCVQELRLLLASAARRACRAARPCSYAEERAAGDVRHCPACRACAFCSAECAAAAALGGAAHSPEVCLGLQHLPSLQLDAGVRRSSCYTPARLKKRLQSQHLARFVLQSYSKKAAGGVEAVRGPWSGVGAPLRPSQATFARLLQLSAPARGPSEADFQLATLLHPLLHAVFVSNLRLGADLLTVAEVAALLALEVRSSSFCTSILTPDSGCERLLHHGWSRGGARCPWHGPLPPGVSHQPRRAGQRAFSPLR